MCRHARHPLAFAHAPHDAQARFHESRGDFLLLLPEGAGEDEAAIGGQGFGEFRSDGDMETGEEIRCDHRPCARGLPREDVEFADRDGEAALARANSGLHAQTPWRGKVEARGGQMPETLRRP